MKLILGETLREKLKGSYKQEEMVQVFLKLCDAVDYAHSKGIVLLDIKPDNIQISDHGEVLLLDWGLAHIQLSRSGDEQLERFATDQFECENMTLDGVIKGTPGYMSAEQIRQERKSTSMDIFSLGCVLFEILHGQPAIEGQSNSDIVDNTLAHNLTVVSDKLPYGLKAILKRSLAKEPQDRYASVISLKSDLSSYVAGFATEAENASPLRLLQ